MIGVITCECIIYDAQSLKEKRSVLKSVLTKLRQRLNVTVAETAHQNVWQRTEIAIAAIANDKTVVEKELQRALKMIDGVPEIERTVTTIEWL
ncbi:DUF503 domain-containing protein [Desertibacillus haloalkaliphilus]|uniref:DUF503 domain-containing protein n=1 Tax=Desertibacillus haloalkaliphilus TaxID=1328930 RepID=UPI001C260FE3|nr:DUF503 domain-containing protein [Desertibacillus haloalkaliphilus]MBU8906970.1 DUF503 family protein [Desertibacillus haloalkaliphilus]